MCDSCEGISINSVNCHEIGCPDAWQDCTVECSYCGEEFKPSYRGQNFCDDSCYNAMWGES